ncbi:SurA N-terminal domain-containing protein [Erythrobacter sp. SDW2]|uniref:SurA N-terminal domain-containing protein n=1 Tax=Erythrobacter sp. SDW2 TaxID=2907154 RepID=UPI001F25C495|nr:SurA N-terminal domain-containing protein [Erythrobacter sp. SDW2]UIP05714.1 SurA N-terminal domain-containing protein [Erythrobacter sp. SDW2]
MITTFRKFFQSKLGIAFTLAFLGLIAIAFASADVSGNNPLGAISSGDKIAVVGDEKVEAAELDRAARNALEQMRQNNPTLSMPAFVEQGGLEQVVDTLLDRVAISEFGKKYGIRASDNLINSQIRLIPAFRGPDGNFSEQMYRDAISRQGLSEAQVRDDLGNGLIAQQVVQPAGLGASMPDKISARYAALFKERRKGSIALLESDAYAPAGAPTDKQLAAYYSANRGDYIRPERRVIRYATFGEEAVGTIAAPTDAEIAARYKQDASRYAAKEERTLTQLVVPTQASADSIRQRVLAGASLEAVAREAGLATAVIGPIAKGTYSSQTSAAVADAAFSAAQGQVAAVARSGLGFHVVRVDAIDKQAGQTLDQARSAIAAQLTDEKRRLAFNELAADIEDRFGSGESLIDVARELKVEVKTTKPLTAAGVVYGTDGETAPQELAPALATAFQMEEEEPQLAEAVPGVTFMLFEASQITPSAAAPLTEIREQVVADWRRAEGAKQAKLAAGRVIERVEGGETLAAAVAAERRALPPVDFIDTTREDLARSQRVPAPLALFFSMAQGTQKQLEGPRNIGWFVLDLDSIEAGTLAADDPLLGEAKRQFAQTLVQEYEEQFQNAIRADVTVERNQSAIDALKRSLAGDSQP